jgi:hypothetical protein
MKSEVTILINKMFLRFFFTQFSSSSTCLAILCQIKYNLLVKKFVLGNVLLKLCRIYTLLAGCAERQAQNNDVLITMLPLRKQLAV